MLKLRKIYGLLVIGLGICFVTGISATESFAQKSGKGRYRKVSVKKNARKNGYKITVEAQVSYFEAQNVEDPVTKKLLEGLKQLEYRCREDDSLTTTNLIFSAGNSQRRRVSCPILIEPTILLGEIDD